MHKDFSIVVAFGSHYGSTNLAQPHPMAPSGSMKSESDIAIVVGISLNHESRTVEMRRRQCTANLKFFAYGHCALVANNLQTNQST